MMFNGLEPCRKHSFLQKILSEKLQGIILLLVMLTRDSKPLTMFLELEGVLRMKLSLALAGWLTVGERCALPVTPASQAHNISFCDLLLIYHRTSCKEACSQLLSHSVTGYISAWYSCIWEQFACFPEIKGVILVSIKTLSLSTAYSPRVHSLAIISLTRTWACFCLGFWGFWGFFKCGSKSSNKYICYIQAIIF